MKNAPGDRGELFPVSGAEQNERELSQQKENNCRSKRIFLSGRAFYYRLVLLLSAPIVPFQRRIRLCGSAT